MPWWAIIYLVLFIIFIVGAVYVSFREGEPRLLLVFDSFTGIVFAYLVTAFWLHPLREVLGWFAPVAFAIAIGWEIADTPRELRKIHSDPELSDMEKRLAPVIGIGICIPAYVLAGMTAFR